MANTVQAAEIIEEQIVKLRINKQNMESIQAALMRDGYKNRDLQQRIDEVDNIIKTHELTVAIIRSTHER